MSKAPARPKASLKHLAPLILGYMRREEITARELGIRLGVPNNSGSVISGWVKGLNGPSTLYRTKLAALLKVDEAELLARGKAPPAEVTARALEAHLQAPPPPAQVIAPRKQEPVLAYSAGSDGQAEVRLLARGPHARMAVVFRLLLDAGLVPGGEEEDA